MKKYFILVLAVLLTMGLASSALAAISGSAHDLSGGDLTTNPTAEICIVCHTPHNAMVAELLWNHEATGNTTFSMYSNTSIDSTNSGSPTGISKMCLGCHDGSTSIDSYGGLTGSTVIGDFSAGFQIGTGGDLSTTHPISMTYPDGTAGAGTDDEIISRTVDLGGNTGAIATVLEGGLLQCSSCHDVHNGFETVTAPLLRVSMTGSALCLGCHDK